MAKLKLFVDFWNFQLDWNNLVGKTDQDEPIPIPWKNQLPRVLCEAVGKKRNEPITYAGTHVYASVDPTGDTGLRKFLHAMDSFPGYSVMVKERKARSGGIRCTKCHTRIKTCPSCQERLRRTVEKGIDAAIITDMIQMGYDDIYDVAVLASSDADLSQAVKFIGNRIGRQVYSLWFPAVGHDLRNACWDHFPVTDLLEELGVQQATPRSEAPDSAG